MEVAPHGSTADNRTIPDIWHPRRQCKNVKVRVIFSYPAQREPLCNFVYSVLFHMSNYRTQVSLVRSIYLSICVNLTDVTQADEDTDSILTDNINRAIQGNVAMRLNLLAKFVTYASDLIETKMLNSPMRKRPLTSPT